MKTNTLPERLCLAFCFIMYSYISLWANPDYYFKQISLQEGLTQSTVRCILIDHKGFIWLGTKSGLNRYDHTNMKTYFNEQGNAASLPNNQINFIAEDSLLNIWVATETGLVRYNQEHDNFEQALFEDTPIIARSFLHQKDGILFGERGRLLKFDYQKKEIQKIQFSNSKPLSTYFHHIRQWKNNKLLIGSRWSGMWVYDTQTKEIDRTDFFDERSIISMIVDNENKLWVSPYGKGIKCYSPDGVLLHDFTTANSSLSNDVILDMVVRNNQLWLATDGGGISILDMEKHTFSVIEPIPGNVYSLPVNSIFCLYKSDENNIWAGSIRGGLFGIREVFIKTYKDVPMNNSYGLSEKTVLSLCEDNDGMIWVGTDGGGINRMDPSSGAFRHYPSTYKDKVASITEYTDDELLIYLFSKGVFRFNKQTGKTTPFIMIDEKENDRICRSGITVNLNRYAPGKIHFFADKIYTYDIQKKEFSTIEYTGKKEAPISSLLKLYSNEYVTYLFGQHHIFELNNRYNTIAPIYELEDPNQFINTACRDGNGNFWLGTGKGLICYNPILFVSRHIETKLFNEVSSLIFDRKGRIWIGAQGSVFAYIPGENKFAIFGESDGAYPNEFLTKPVLASQTGDILMGGVTGLMHINKDIDLTESTQPSIELIDLELNGRSIINEISGTVNIPWNYTSLNLRHMVREEDIFRKKMFRYTVLGLNKEPIETYEQMLSLYSLPTGQYDIMVSCSVRDGSWSTPVHVLSLSVTPPWWKSTWFMLLSLTLIMGGIIVTSIIIIRRNENKLKWEMKEHEQRTQEDKVRFLINISHELRTPLTLIYAPLKRLLNRELNDENIKTQLTGIFKQAKQMRNIINMVLDVRKMEVGNDTIHLSPHRLNDWLQAIADDFRLEFAAKNIRIKYEPDPSIQNISFDEGKCEIIFSNLLMNALKFSPEDTEVTIRTQLIDNSARISIIDQGIGLHGVDTSKLFTRFYQGVHQVKGSGIGLSYAKTLVEMHNGQIGAVNNPGCGATFWFSLPATNTSAEILCEKKPYLNELLHTDSKRTEEPGIFDTRPYSLLVVEDEPDLRAFLKATLREFFRQVYIAEDGQEALDLIKQYQPDVIVSDVMMPRMDGFELCGLVKGNLDISHTPIILLTARSDQESTSLGYKLGADAYLAKPFEVEFLQTLIANQLRNRQYMKSRYKKSMMTISPQEMTFSNADEKFLLRLNNHIIENISSPTLDVKFLTDNMGMSRASLYSKLKSLTDMGVNDYINKHRIEKACLLLVETDMSIMEVSDAVGFSNQRYFSTVFKQATGKTPTIYKGETVQKRQ